jgi:hypothetical protein
MKPTLTFFEDQMYCKLRFDLETRLLYEECAQLKTFIDSSMNHKLKFPMRYQLHTLLTDYIKSKIISQSK